mmetsp:Transcript_12694/g.18214  ORF Transcript_12694/g.18214 Transcript_12694/m.18214 type:complete len:231 (+) Transcript_12694:153-845(+)
MVFQISSYPTVLQRHSSASHVVFARGCVAHCNGDPASSRLTPVVPLPELSRLEETIVHFVRVFEKRRCVTFKTDHVVCCAVERQRRDFVLRSAREIQAEKPRMCHIRFEQWFALGVQPCLTSQAVCHEGAVAEASCKHVVSIHAHSSADCCGDALQEVSVFVVSSWAATCPVPAVSDQTFAKRVHPYPLLIVQHCFHPDSVLDQLRRTSVSMKQYYHRHASVGWDSLRDI